MSAISSEIMILVVIVQMFFLDPTKSVDKMMYLGWGIVSVIVLGISICWVCTVIKKIIFLFCQNEENPQIVEKIEDTPNQLHDDSHNISNLSNLSKTSARGELANKKEEVKKVEEKKEIEEKEIDDIDEDKLDEEEISQIEGKSMQEASKEEKKMINDKKKALKSKTPRVEVKDEEQKKKPTL